MIIAISQSKLLQRTLLWMWHTSHGSATSTFHKHVQVVICHLVR